MPDHILKPPYVNSHHTPGIASGPEIHDEMGKESMWASGRLAAQVLEYAGTLVQVIDYLIGIYENPFCTPILVLAICLS